MSRGYIKNIDKLMQKLKEMGKDKQIVGGAVKKAGLQVRDEAKLNCPVDTGNLRNSIKCSQPKQDGGGNWYVEVYTNTEYAVYVEFGTGQKGQSTNTNSDVSVSYRQDGCVYQDEEGSWWYTTGQPAQPFLYPALKDNEYEIKKGIAKSVEKGFKRYCK